MHAHATPGGAVATGHPEHATRPSPTTQNPSTAILAALFVGILCAILFACGDSSTIVGVDNKIPSPVDSATLQAAQIQLVGGDAQEGVVASVLPQPLVVQVNDAEGAPLGGAPVEWQFYQGRGSDGSSRGFASGAVSQTTDSHGRASVQWQLGTKAGIQTASVRIVTSDVPAASSSDGLVTAPKNDHGKKVGLTARAKPSDISSIDVSPSTATLLDGDSLQLSAQVMDSYGNTLDGASLSWSSSNDSVAAASNDGTVVAVQPGSAVITAKSGSTTGTADITTTADTATSSPSVARVVASPDTVQFASLSESATISAVALDSVGTPIPGVTFGFWSSNTSVVSVDATGLLTPKAAGEAVVTATAQCCGKSDSVVVQVTGGELTITVIDQSSTIVSNLSLQVGESASLAATATSSLGVSIGEVAASWSSTSPQVASVSSAGVVTALSSGNTDIVASYQGATATVSTTVTSSSSPPPPSSGNLVFASDFGTALGSSVNALTDGGRWNGAGHNLGDGTLEVVDATTAGIEWPSAHALEVHPIGSSSEIVRVDGLPVPSVGESLYYRWYVRVSQPDNVADQQNHPIQEVTAAYVNWYFNIFTGSYYAGPGMWHQRWNVIGEPPGTEKRWAPPDLYKNTTYRFEMQIDRVATDSMQMHARVYILRPTGEALLYTDKDIKNNAGSGSLSLADNYTLVLRDASTMATLQAGTNGQDGGPYPFSFNYQGAFAVCVNDWCGPYTPGEGG